MGRFAYLCIPFHLPEQEFFEVHVIAMAGAMEMDLQHDSVPAEMLEYWYGLGNQIGAILTWLQAPQTSGTPC